MQATTNQCSSCSVTDRIRRRDFSDQAWAVLLVWNEISKDQVGKPLCDTCYDELREVLIDRADEIEASISGAKKGRKRSPRVRKAS